MSASAILALVLLAALALPAILLVREVRALRAAGISDQQPGCGRCRYRMRGWGAPVCPECGADVREAGIVTGSKRARGLAGQVALLAVVLVGVVSFLVAAAVARLDAVTTTKASIDSVSTADPRLAVEIDLEMSEAAGSADRSIEGMVAVACDGDPGSPTARVRIPIRSRDEVPGRAQLRAALERVGRGDLDSATLDAHADALSNLLERVKIASAVNQQAPPWGWPAVSYSVRRDEAPVSLLFLVVPAIVFVVLAILTDQWFPTPRCVARDREWE